MKKQILLAILAIAVTATSCSKDESIAQAQQESQAIDFKTYVPKLSRGAVIGNATQLQSTDFEVFAFKAATGLTFMDAVKIVYNGTKWDYDQATQRAYWSADAVNFYSVSPSSNAALTKNFTADAQTLDFTVPADCGDQIDLMYTQVLGADKSNRSGAGSGQTTGGVPFNFEHALTQVVFKAKTAVADFKIDIESVEICNAMGTGTFTYSTKAWTGLSASSSYVSGMAVPSTSIGTTTVDLTTSASGALLLLPQTMTAWTTKVGEAITIAQANENGHSYLKIMCKIINTIGGDSYLYGDADTYMPVYIPFGVAWSKSNVYTYTLVFGNTDSGSEGGNSGGGTGGGGNGGGFDDEGYPILKDLLITFDPTVATWTNNPNDVNM